MNARMNDRHLLNQELQIERLDPNKSLHNWLVSYLLFKRYLASIPTLLAAYCHSGQFLVCDAWDPRACACLVPHLTVYSLLAQLCLPLRSTLLGSMCLLPFPSSFRHHVDLLFSPFQSSISNFLPFFSFWSALVADAQVTPYYNCFPEAHLPKQASLSWPTCSRKQKRFPLPLWSDWSLAPRLI